MGSLFIEQWEIVKIFYHSHFLAISRWRSTSSDPSNSPSSPRLVILWDGDGVAEIDVAETPILLSDGYKRYSFQLVSVKHKRLLVSFQWNDSLFRFTSFIFVYMFPHGPCGGPNTWFDWPMKKKISSTSPPIHFHPYISHLMPWLNLSPPMTSIPLSWPPTSHPLLTNQTAGKDGSMKNYGLTLDH